MSREFTASVDVRFSDLDAYGHVNSAVYFTYLESARLKLFSDQLRGLSEQGIFVVVARAACEYRHPITLTDRVQVTVTMARLGNASFELEYRLHDAGDTTYATATTTMVCFDNRAKTPVPLPESIRTLA